MVKVIHAIVDNMRPTSIRRYANGWPKIPAGRSTLPQPPHPGATRLKASSPNSPASRLKRGVFRSVVDLPVAINRFVAETNADPKPFVWTADPKRVLAAVKRGKQTLETLLAGTGLSSFALLEHRFEFFFERSRRNAEHAKPRQVVRGCGVDLHKLDLIAGERRVRQDFSDAGN